ncbi:MAG TPA: cache domain-containing protein [Noviherbaspirillum sp.]|nr:cache domain-containing protein [Noviherbaspirillum sp.]
MKNLLNRLILAAAAFTAVAPAIAASDKGTPEEAVALVKKVIAYYKANGKDKTFAEVNAQNPEFKYKDLYVFGSIVKEGAPLAAHGANPKMVGKDMTMLKDAEGFPFAKRIIEIGNSKGGKGWVDYKWPNPVTKVIEQKSTYVERVDDVYFACGVYK